MTWTGTVTDVTLCLVDREMTKKFTLSWAAHVTELKKQIHTGGEDLGQAGSTAILGPGEADRRTQHFLAMCSGAEAPCSVQRYRHILPPQPKQVGVAEQGTSLNYSSPFTSSISFCSNVQEEEPNLLKGKAR